MRKSKRKNYDENIKLEVKNFKIQKQLEITIEALHFIQKIIHIALKKISDTNKVHTEVTSLMKSYRKKRT